jgi:hypothetical protein
MIKKEKKKKKKKKIYDFSFNRYLRLLFMSYNGD